MPNKLKAVSPTPTAQFPAANCQYFLLALHQIVQVTVDQHFHRPFIRPRFPSQRTHRIFESDKSELLHSQAVLPFGNPTTQSPRTLQKISHMILQGFGPMIFLKMLQTKRLQSTVVDVRERNSQTTPL